LRKRPFQELVRALYRPRILLVGGFLAVMIAIERELAVIGPLVFALSRRLGQIPALSRLGMADYVALGLLVVLFLGVFAAWRGRGRAEEGRASSAYVEAFRSFWAQDKAVLLLSFVVLFRTGESFLMKMRWPFLNQEVHMALQDYAIYNGSVGVAASIGATLVGGWLIARLGLRKCIWPFVLAQNVLNLMYMVVALAAEPHLLPEPILAAVIAIEHAGAGLGTAVFMVFLMRCCDPA